MQDKTARKILFSASIICILIFLVLIPFRFSGSLVRSDGIGYYTYLRSLVFDKDVNLYNEYIHFNYIPRITSTGFTSNQWTIGPAILWMPFYLCAHLINLLLRGVGIPIKINGYELFYQSAVCIGTIIYVCVGFYLIYRITRRYFSVFSSILAVLGVWLAANPIYYTIIEPSMSQGVQLFTTVLFMYIWLPFRFRTYKDWFFIGITVGLMALIHWQNLIFISVLVAEGFYFIIKSEKDKKWAVVQRYIKGGFIAICVALLIYAPQMLAWNVMFGFPIVNPRDLNQLDLLHPKLLQYLFFPGCSAL